MTATLPEDGPLVAPQVELIVATDEADMKQDALDEMISAQTLPTDSVLIFSDAATETEIPGHGGAHRRAQSHTRIASISDLDFLIDVTFHVDDWDGRKKYSDLIEDGLRNKPPPTNSIVMLYESPSSSASDTSFYNRDKYRFHDWPPAKSSRSKGMLGPCRYALMNGNTYPVFLRENPPAGLATHWLDAVPGCTLPTYTNTITDDDTAYAYLPAQQIKNHLNDPETHYHLAGKDAIHLMTQKTTRLLPNTTDVRPCVVKTTHSMGSKGIFIISDDEDQAEFEQFLKDSGNPTYVVTDFVDIHRNVACHFFIHPTGRVVWLGSNENIRGPDGKFSSDSYLYWKDQKVLKEMQLPFVEHVVQYCLSLGFWGFCGIDVLFDGKGNGYMVDVNPRVTGSCPALMTLKKMNETYKFDYGLFRRSGGITYYGSADKLFKEVKEYNDKNEGDSRIVIHSLFEAETELCKINIGVYGKSMEKCQETLIHFAKSKPNEEDTAA